MMHTDHLLGWLAVLPDEVLALLAVADTGSVTRAAERVHLTQSALSRRLQRLAARVGVPLLEPRGRHVALTPAGEAVVAAARRQLADWESVLAGVRGHTHPPLRLGCGATIALSLLPAALARLRQEMPHLPLVLRSMDSAATAAGCLAGELDAGLVTTASADPRLVAVPLATDDVVAVGPRGWPSRLTLRELALGPLCLYARGTGFRSLIEELLGSAGLFPEPVAQMDSLEALRELVCVGLGRSLLPRSVCAAAAAAGRLEVLVVEGLPPTARTIALLRRRDRPPHPAFAALQRALLSVAGGAAGIASPRRNPGAG